MRPEALKQGDRPSPLEERITVMAQKTLVEIQRKGGEVVERDDLGCRDVFSPDKTRIFRVSSEGKDMVSLIATSGTVEFPLMRFSRPDEGDRSRTPQLTVPAYEEKKYQAEHFEVTFGRNGPEGNWKSRRVESSESAFYDLIRKGLVPSLENLPEDVDIGATVEALFARVLEGDFSPPEVVRKPSAQIVYDRIEATLERADLPRPLGRLNIFKPRSQFDERASRILEERGLRGGFIPVIVCVGTDVNENGILSISGETRVYSGLFLSHLVFDLSVIAPDLSSSSRKIKMKVVRSLGGKVYLAPESSDAGGGQIYLSRTASGQEQYSLIAIYKANGETVVKVLPLQLPERVLTRAMKEVVEPVAVVGAATPLTPGATVLSSGRIYPSGEGGINPRKVQQQIHEDRIGAGDIVYEGGGIRRKRGKKRKAQKKRTKTREPRYGGGRRWH